MVYFEYLQALERYMIDFEYLQALERYMIDFEYHQALEYTWYILNFFKHWKILVRF